MEFVSGGIFRQCEGCGATVEEGPSPSRCLWPPLVAVPLALHRLYGRATGLMRAVNWSAIRQPSHPKHRHPQHRRPHQRNTSHQSPQYLSTTPAADATAPPNPAADTPGRSPSAQSAHATPPAEHAHHPTRQPEQSTRAGDAADAASPGFTARSLPAITTSLNFLSSAIARQRFSSKQNPAAYQNAFADFGGKKLW